MPPRRFASLLAWHSPVLSSIQGILLNFLLTVFPSCVFPVLHAAVHASFPPIPFWIFLHSSESHLFSSARNLGHAFHPEWQRNHIWHSKTLYVCSFCKEGWQTSKILPQQLPIPKSIDVYGSFHSPPEVVPPPFSPYNTGTGCWLLLLTPAFSQDRSLNWHPHTHLHIYMPLPSRHNLHINGIVSCRHHICRLSLPVQVPVDNVGQRSQLGPIIGNTYRAKYVVVPW